MDAVIVDSELVPLLDAAPSFSFSAEVLPSIREAGLGVPVELSDAVERTDHVVSTDPHVVVRVHRPKGVTEALPCIYSIHGGGYILGSYDMDDARFDRYCTLFPCVGVSVEYRLAPETPYPGSAGGLLRGLEVDLRAQRRARYRRRSGSGSPGSARVAASPPRSRCSTRDRGEVPLQLPAARVPHDRRPPGHVLEPARRAPDLEPRLERVRLAELPRRSLRHRRHSDLRRAARATDLSGLPPALVIVGGADGFRDEDIDYAMRLNQCGVPTELHVLPGAPHGVQMFAGSVDRTAVGPDGHDWLGAPAAPVSSACAECGLDPEQLTIDEAADLIGACSVRSYRAAFAVARGRPRAAARETRSRRVVVARVRRAPPRLRSLPRRAHEPRVEGGPTRVRRSRPGCDRAERELQRRRSRRGARQPRATDHALRNAGALTRARTTSIGSSSVPATRSPCAS